MEIQRLLAGAYGIFYVQENYSIKAYDSNDQQIQIQWFFFKKMAYPILIFCVGF